MPWEVEFEAGRPARMWWIKPPPPSVTPKYGCEYCGFHFGWHRKDCKQPLPQTSRPTDPNVD